ncbi:MAG: ABC transporter substrate-binding protein [Hyphomicrobiales bacterium]|nr:ABC transporter substrate-binding protein [Hyphomicrobiales bacterium]
MSDRHSKIITFFFVLAVALPTIGNPADGQELRVGYPVDIATLDPADHRDRWTEIILRNLYDGLLTHDPLMRLVPDIAETWTQINPTVYEFKLRDGIMFQSGRPLEADDVVFSFERMIKPGPLGRRSPRASLLGPLKSVHAVNRKTIRFELSEPWPVFPVMIPFQQVIERPEQQGAEGGESHNFIGSGPFRLANHYPGVALVFKRYDDYFGGPKEVAPTGKSCVERLEINVVPSNESRVAGLLAGDFDLVVDILPHSVPVIERNPRTSVVSVDGTRSFFIIVNNAVPPFDNLLVREAVALALDREALIAGHLSGEATLIDGILSPFAFGKNPDLERRSHDPERARKLLAEAGLQQGFALELDVNPQFFEIAEAIALQLAQIGISVKTVISDPTETAARWRKSDNRWHGRMWLGSWGNASLDPVGIFDPTHRTGGRGNFSNYSNTELDALLEKAAGEQNFARRAELYRQAEMLANQDLPYIYLWVPKDIYGVSKRIRGFEAAPDGRLNLQDVCVD